MKKFSLVLIMVFLAFIGTVIYILSLESVFKTEFAQDYVAEEKGLEPYPITEETLPGMLRWKRGDKVEIFSSDEAKSGGEWNEYIDGYPLTFRQFGKNANGSFRNYLDTYSDMGLLERHPDTGEFHPSLATKWAFGKDKRTVYFELDSDARWSDGHPITADDYIFRLKLMRAKNILAPWYNDYYLTQIEEVLKFSDYKIAIRLPKPKAELLASCVLSPLPRHFYGKLSKQVHKFSLKDARLRLERQRKEIPAELIALEKEYQGNLAKEAEGDLSKEPKFEVEIDECREDFNAFYHWQVPPVAGPYIINSWIKEKQIVFRKVKDWWAKSKKFYDNRFNPSSIRLHVIKDPSSSFEYFKAGRLDSFMLILPEFWHDRAQYMEAVSRGYMYKTWFYNDSPQASRLISFNVQHPLLDNQDLREGIIYALDLGKMCRTVLRGDYELLDTFNEGYGDYSHPTLKARRFDATKAIEFFEKAGFSELANDGIRRNSEGKKLSFRILYSTANHTDRILVLKEEARKLGLELVLETFDQGSVFKQMLEKKYEILWHGWGGGGISPRYRQFYHKSFANRSNNNNMTNVVDDELSQLCDDYRESIDRDKRVKLAHRLEEGIYEMALAQPTYKVPYFRSVQWSWIKYPQDIMPMRTSQIIFDHGLFWIDQEVKEEVLSLKRQGKNYTKGGDKMRINKKWKKD